MLCYVFELIRIWLNVLDSWWNINVEIKSDFICHNVIVYEMSRFCRDVEIFLHLFHDDFDLQKYLWAWVSVRGRIEKKQRNLLVTVLVDTTTKMPNKPTKKAINTFECIVCSWISKLMSNSNDISLLFFSYCLKFF